MRALILLASVLVRLTSAAPRPQDIDFDLAYALPNPTYSTVTDATAQIVSYNPTTVFSAASSQITATDTETALDATISAFSGVGKRSACATQPMGHGPIATPDTASAFLALPAISSAAVNAPLPSGYTQTFMNRNGSSSAYAYMGFTTLEIYNSTACAAKCDAMNGCISFNLYFERDPTVEPGSDCDNPASTTMIKCVFWGGPISSENALNTGQWRDQFQVAIAGSNGYTNNSVAAVPGYKLVGVLGHSAIDAPYDQYGFNSHMGNVIFLGAFDAQLCAQACSEKSAAAIADPPADGSPVQTCQFFNTYILYINTTAHIQGQYCAMYSESWPSNCATNIGQNNNKTGDHFLLEYSFTYSNISNPGSAQTLPAVYQAKREILSADNMALPYCSSVLGYSTPVTTSTISASNATSMPQVLSKYPLSIVSSACALAASPVTQTTMSSNSSTATTTDSGRGSDSTSSVSTSMLVSVSDNSSSLSVLGPSSSMRLSAPTTSSSLPVFSITSSPLPFLSITSTTLPPDPTVSSSIAAFTDTPTNTDTSATPSSTATASSITSCAFAQSLGTFAIQASSNGKFAVTHAIGYGIEDQVAMTGDNFNSGGKFTINQDCVLTEARGWQAAQGSDGDEYPDWQILFMDKGIIDAEPGRLFRTTCQIDEDLNLTCLNQGKSLMGVTATNLLFTAPGPSDLVGLATATTLKAVLPPPSCGFGQSLGQFAIQADYNRQYLGTSVGNLLFTQSSAPNSDLFVLDNNCILTLKASSGTSQIQLFSTQSSPVKIGGGSQGMTPITCTIDQSYNIHCSVLGRPSIVSAQLYDQWWMGNSQALVSKQASTISLKAVPVSPCAFGQSLGQFAIQADYNRKYLELSTIVSAFYFSEYSPAQATAFALDNNCRLIFQLNGVTNFAEPRGFSNYGGPYEVDMSHIPVSQEDSKYPRVTCTIDRGYMVAGSYLNFVLHCSTPYTPFQGQINDQWFMGDSASFKNQFLNPGTVISLTAIPLAPPPTAYEPSA